MRFLAVLRRVLGNQIFWILIFILALLSKTHVVIQVLVFLVMILGLRQFHNILLYWLYRLRHASEISLGGISLKLPPFSEVEIPPDLRTFEPSDEALSERLLIKAFQSFSEGRYDEALVLAESAAEKFPNHYKAYAFLGSICDPPPISNPAKAVKYNQKALALRPESFVPQFNLAVATNHIEGPEKSLKEYLKAEEFTRKENIDMESEIIGKLNLFLADDYKKTGNLEEAALRYKRAEEILGKLAARGDRTSQHWLTAARKRRDELAAMQKESK